MRSRRKIDAFQMKSDNAAAALSLARTMWDNQCGKDWKPMKGKAPQPKRGRVCTREGRSARPSVPCPGSEQVLMSWGRGRGLCPRCSGWAAGWDDASAGRGRAAHPPACLRRNTHPVTRTNTVHRSVLLGESSFTSESRKMPSAASWPLGPAAGSFASQATAAGVDHVQTKTKKQSPAF